MRKICEFVKQIGAGILTGIMAVSLLSGIPAGDMKQVEAAATLSKPRTSSGVVTWDCVYFGRYPQSDATGETKEPIKWRVLSVVGFDAFLVADCNLDAQWFHNKFEEVTWENSIMRSWLNGYGISSNKAGYNYSNSNFIDRAFYEVEQKAILSTTVANSVGNDTTDKIFLLSYDDVTNSAFGFSSDFTSKDSARIRLNTAYVGAGGSSGSKETKAAGQVSFWRLRTMAGNYNKSTMNISIEGDVNTAGVNVEYAKYGVCPALHLDLSKTDLWSYAGTVNSDGVITEGEAPPVVEETEEPEKEEDNNMKDDGSKDDESKDDESKDDGSKDDESKDDGSKDDESKDDESKDDELKDDNIEENEPDKSEAVSLVRIKAEKAQLTYQEGEVLALQDLTVTAVYSDGTEVKVTNYTTNAASIDMSTAGAKNLIVTYQEGDIVKTAIVSIEVIERMDEEAEEETVYISKIQLTGISKKISAGKKVQLTATIIPENATNQELIWSSSNEKYATVNSEGKVSVKKNGAGKTVTITAASIDGSGVKVNYTIRIMKHAVKKIVMNGGKTQTVKAGKSLKLKTTIQTTGKSANKTLNWTSSNTKYATVTKKGKVVTKKSAKGKKVKITARATDGSNKKATVTIKIK